MDAKRCPRCGETKPLSEWQPAGPSRHDGLQTYCKPCFKEYRAERYRKNPQYKEKIDAWKRTHPEKVREINRKKNSKRDRRTAGPPEPTSVEGVRETKISPERPTNDNAKEAS